MSDQPELTEIDTTLPDPLEIEAPSEQTIATPAPVASSERFASMDVLRGFALCGILVMNIISFGLPQSVYMNPTLSGGFSGLNFLQWVIAELFFEGKMMSTFSMLFGAGLVLMTDRTEAKGGSPAAFFYRRAGILLIFGLLHGYLLWVGDILYSYALCGMLVYLFRNRGPLTLIMVGILFLSVALFTGQRMTWFGKEASAAAKRVEATKEAGTTPSERDKEFAKVRGGMREMFESTPESVAKDVKIHREGSYIDILKKRAPETFAFESVFFIMFIFWGVTARMLFGMALLKLGVFTAKRSRNFYIGLMLFGYGVGLPLAGYGAWTLYQHNFNGSLLFGDLGYNEVGSILVALGHIGALLVIYTSGVLSWLTSRLAAVGRMALTNYLSHTLICTTLFYGYGFGLYDRLDRVGLMAVVFTVWAFQLWISPIWLRHFKFGPVEWLWRSLTYGKAQPFRVA